MSGILGLDPAMISTGYACVFKKKRMAYLNSGYIKVKNKLPSSRLLTLYQTARKLIFLNNTKFVVIEKIFLLNNPSSSFKLIQAQTALVVGALKKKLDISYYNAGQVKNYITGKGCAQKDEVQFVINNIFNLRKCKNLDETDALSIAVLRAQD